MTTHPQHIQITLNAPPETIFAALTDPAQLEQWFAERADVSIPDNRYDFWGRYTPDNPSRDEGRHTILDLEPNRHLKFAWLSFGQDSIVEIALHPRGSATLLVMRHYGKNYEDFWFLSLENLRRHVEGKGPAVRYDYTRPATGDVRHSLDINAPAHTVFGLLTEPEQLDRWISSTAKVRPTVGGEIDYGWTGVPALQILSLKPDEELSGKWLDPDGDTIVKWTLEESDGKTHLTFVHSGFAPEKRTDDLNPGWLNFMSWVKSAAEFGTTWSTALKSLSPEQIPYYPGSMAPRQSEIFWVAPRRSATQLGDYVEIQTPVPDVEAAHALYLALGFQAINDRLLTDGRINIRLVDGTGQTRLVYNGSTLEYFTDPTGLPVEVTPLDGINPAMSGSANKPSHASVGKFGEFALACADVSGTSAFWEQFGFKTVYASNDPMPWAILSDDTIVLGLHQSETSGPNITYFDANMAEHIARLAQNGITVKSFDPPSDGPITNAKIVVPGGQGIYLFTGEI